MTGSPTTLRDRLFWAVTRSRNLRELVSFAGDESCPAGVEGAVSNMLAKGSDVAREWRGLQSELPQEWIEVAGFLALTQMSRRPSLESNLELAGRELLEDDSYFWLLFEYLRCKHAIQNGNAAQAEHCLHRAEEWCDRHRGKFFAEVAKPYVLRVKGLYSQLVGDLGEAFKHLREAHRRCVELGSALASDLSHEWGTLLWQSGQHSEALAVHTDADHREKLSSRSPEALVRSHLAAAKCAIDLEDLVLAEKELRAAEQLIRETERISQLSQGYMLLYRGELALASGASQGFDLLEQACEEFEAIDPPFAAGLLDAKISITQFAIRTDDHARMFSILHSILAEAEEKGCLEARARCLVFESSLFVSENPPLKGAFENLITRLHLINNPALLLQALGNLFIYSLRHLEEPDQAFLMARLRNLQEVLEEGCYQDLYETYIEKRYSWAIENRLAQFLEGDQDWHEEDDREMTE